MTWDEGNPTVPHKVLWHLDRLQQYRNRGWCWPLVADLWLTDRCQHSCPECAGYRQTSTDLPVDYALRFLREFRGSGGLSVTVAGGGEPTLHASLSDILQAGQDVGLKLALITNGDRFVESQARTILRTCSWLRISMDAYDADSHLAMHGVNRFGSVVENISRYVAQREPGSQCKIGVSYLTCATTIPGIADATQMCRELGVDYIQFRPLFDNFDDSRDAIAEAKQFETDTFKVLASTPKYDRFTSIRRYDACYGHWLGAVLKTNGRFGVCCCNGTLEFGSMADGFAESWLSTEHRQVIGQIDLKHCPSHCRWNAMNELLWRIFRPAMHGEFI